MTEIQNAYVIVLCGGAGTRLWPLSRENYPKYLRSFGGTESLLDAAIRRALLIVPASHIRLVTAAAQSTAVIKIAKAHGVANVVVEPVSRGTTAALLLALARVAVEPAPSVVISMPADHLIEDEDAWSEAIRAAVGQASTGGVVTLGIVPHRPATEYGYIEMHSDRCSPVVRVRHFHEKPDRLTAVAYVESGAYLWNTAIMAFRQDVIFELLEQYAPQVLRAFRNSLIRGTDEVSWNAMPSLALEHALMEPAAADSLVHAVPARFGWRDVGTWDEAAELVRTTDAVVVGSDGIVVIGGESAGDVKRRYVFVGVHDLIVVDDGEVVLVTTRGSSGLMRGVPIALVESDWSDLK